ncbi:Spo0E family sporulation regulatory protein-aspartic acid phosphatase [Paenibacillus sp. 481]|uniref:Spo0E family sporulation regulatory protein-aspartic acid phosphatase n=1 Tax=Paenibacillus sp. 481 TaxID=2835869 RepID=UPI001E32EB5C|nr:Spo0E family sporulation regulatory protein-aspartic acid phosphatase [Paenibacillus sp. 481]UHA71802.1 Spo0E family sporulation regulatory protein-aspartic acid phosphatase [Paenibacillus sp. 481]
MDSNLLLLKINQLRNHLEQAVHEHSSFTAEPVILISRSLDDYIVQFQKRLHSRENTVV